MTNFVYPLFTGIGTGSLLASIAWYFKMRQRLLNRLYQEKREVYVLDALRDAKSESLTRRHMVGYRLVSCFMRGQNSRN
jgi:hypothetical protein